MRNAIAPGQIVEKVLPHSEACMHLGVAGRRMRVRMLSEHGADILRDANDLLGRPLPLGGTITLGEAGIRREPDGTFSYNPDLG